MQHTVSNTHCIHVALMLVNTHAACVFEHPLYPCCIHSVHTVYPIAYIVCIPVAYICVHSNIPFAYIVCIQCTQLHTLCAFQLHTLCAYSVPYCIHCTHVVYLHSVLAQLPPNIPGRSCHDVCFRCTPGKPIVSAVCSAPAVAAAAADAAAAAAA